MNSVQSCERLEKEKEELHAAFDGVLQKVQEQHRLDLADLEERLKTFYTNEWEKIQQSYQEEAEKYKGLMEQQVKRNACFHAALSAVKCIHKVLLILWFISTAAFLKLGRHFSIRLHVHMQKIYI